VIYGFLTTLLGGDTAQIAHSLDEEPAGQKRAPPTAIVLPIFNEDVDRVFREIEAMWISLRKARGSQGFDFFILSDSNRPESWLRELVETTPGRSNWKATATSTTRSKNRSGEVSRALTSPTGAL
jgi:membrane glycosyltransferase